MTGHGLPSSDSVLHLLHEAGIPADPPLVGAVREISALGTGPAPEASAELAQLMADGGKVPAGRRNKRRITFIGGALAVSMGVGMSGVAAGTPYFPDRPATWCATARTGSSTLRVLPRGPWRRQSSRPPSR